MTKDQKLWKQFINGDQLALTSIYFDHAESLIQYGKKFTPKYEIAEDALQEVFLSLMRNRKNLTVPENIRFYLLYAFRNCLIREINKSSRIKNSNTVDENEFIVTFDIESDLSKDQIFKQQNLLIDNLLKSTSSKQREAIYLRYKNGLSHQEIASIMNISDQVSRNLISQAIKRMKKQLDILSIDIDSFVLLLI